MNQFATRTSTVESDLEVRANHDLGVISDSTSYFQQWLEQELPVLEQRLDVLEIALVERLTPLFESLSPILYDPLWQFLGCIILLVVLLIATVLLVRILKKVGVSTIMTLIRAIKSPVMMTQTLIKRSWQILIKRSTKNIEQKKSRWSQTISIRQGIDAVRYLTTRRDWRYKSPWYVLIGEEHSGKTRWVDSIRKGARNQLLVREKQLVAKGSNWKFFDQGLIIDIDGEPNFDKTVELLTSYRPERPIDGVIATVSAKALLNAKDELGLQAIGESLYRQLWSVQKHTGFVVPVYLIVTQCDAVDGFSTFWQAQPQSHHDDMFGWSNPTRIDTAYSSSWVLESISSVLEGINKSQLALAASGKEISDIDAFMLFGREFHGLERPLTAVMQSAFARNSFQEALPLRGIWFSGCVNDNVILTEDFVNQKLWPETHLAYPIEKRRFSANKTLRRFQISTLVVSCFLVLALVMDSVRLYQYTKKTEQLWQHIAKSQSDCGETGNETWHLLTSLSDIGEQPVTLTLPASWGGGQLPKLQRAAANDIYPSTVFSGLDCRVKLKAKAIRSINTIAIDHNNSVTELRQQLSGFSNQLVSFQQAEHRFLRLVKPLADDRGIADDFRLLLSYLYDGSIPATIIFDSPLLAKTVAETVYDVKWSKNALVDPMQQLKYLHELTQLVHSKLEESVSEPPVAAIQRAFYVSPSSENSNSVNNGLAMTESIKTLQTWLYQMEHEWISSRKDENPCGLLSTDMDNLQRVLSQAGYPGKQLAMLRDDFRTENCTELIVRKMESLNVAPLGKLFQRNESGKLGFTKEILHWREEFAALESLNVLSRDFNMATVTSRSDANTLFKQNATAGKIIDWNSAPLGEALDMLLQFQSFQMNWWQGDNSNGTEPFYAAGLRDRLSGVVRYLINQSQRRELTQVQAPLSQPQDTEEKISAYIGSFTRVTGVVRQLSALLQQQGDSGNATVLQKSAREFVMQQLEGVSTLVDQNRLYQPLANPRWGDSNFSAALFNKSPTSSLNHYLENQRQRLGHITQGYAKPLIDFLVNSGGINQTESVAQRWYDTLMDYSQYQRQQPGNSIEQLENFITKDLAKVVPSNCTAWLTTPAFHYGLGDASPESLFAVRHYSIDQQARSYCKQYGKTTVLKQYLALAERFNNELSGRYPFANLDKAGVNDLDPLTINTFFKDFRSDYFDSANNNQLLQDLDELTQAQPALSIHSWVEFVAKLDQLEKFWQLNSDKKHNLNVALQLEFAALAKQSRGAAQIVEWQFVIDDTALIYPNGKDQVSWQPGDDLALHLRWATGSDFTPVRGPSGDIQIDSVNHSALFSSQGNWGLFEWLQRFGDGQAQNNMGALLSFYVPVERRVTKIEGTSASLKTAPSKRTSSPAYISKVNLRLTAMGAQSNSASQTIAIPAQLPLFAPGLPGDINGNGG